LGIITGKNDEVKTELDMTKASYRTAMHKEKKKMNQEEVALPIVLTKL